ncbi:MAG: helix-turn-helix transcriptional regulator [Undibacterium sp.]|nr:helix-turn-helix transcriptional regulator [Opitutaceae bacterium]
MKTSTYTKADSVFREFLKELREEQNLTQAQLAKRLDVPQRYVSKFETGERNLNFVETNLVCDALGVNLTKFAARFSVRLAKS